MSRATRFDRSLQDRNVRAWAVREYPTRPTMETVTFYVASQTTVKFTKVDYDLFLSAALAAFEWRQKL